MDTTCLLVFGGATLQTFISTLLCVCFGIPLAHLFYRYEFPCRQLLLASAPFFFMMPSRLAAACIQSLYGCTGLVGIVATHFFLNMPFVFLTVTMAYYASDYTLQLAARDLGACAWRCYKDIVAPYLIPAIMCAASVIGILCFSSHTIPRIFGLTLYHTTPDIMLADAYKNDQYAQSWVYALMRLCVVVPLSFVQASNIPSNSYMQHPRQRLSLKTGQHRIWVFFLLLMAIIMYAPVIALCVKGINQPVFIFWQSIACGIHEPLLGCTVRHAIAMSFCIALVSSCLALGMAFILCLAQRASTTRVLLRGITTITAIPFSLGGVGCSIGCLWVAHYTDACGLLLAIVCHTLFNYPYAYRIIHARYQQYDAQWTLSAMSLGATWWQAVCTIELPFIAHAAWRVLCITAGLSLVEVGAEGIVAGRSVMTMPIAIRLYRDHGLHDQVLGLSLITCLCVWFGTYCMLRQADAGPTQHNR